MKQKLLSILALLVWGISAQAADLSENFSSLPKGKYGAVAAQTVTLASGDWEVLKMEMKENNLTFVATDAHKLVRYRRTDVRSDVQASFIMPKKPINQLKNILGTMGDEPVRIEFNRTNASYVFGDYKLVCRLIEGHYPNYEAVIPANNPNQLTIDRQLFLSAIRRVAVFSSKATHQVRFKISGQEILLTAEDIDFYNEAKERLTCSYEGDDMEIGFNSRFLQEMLGNFDSETIKIEMSAPNRAGIIIPVENENEAEDLLMLLMPVMLN